MDSYNIDKITATGLTYSKTLEVNKKNKSTKY